MLPGTIGWPVTNGQQHSYLFLLGHCRAGTVPEGVCVHRKELVTVPEEVCVHRKELVTVPEEVCVHRKELVTVPKGVCVHRKELVTVPEGVCSQKRAGWLQFIEKTSTFINM